MAEDVGSSVRFGPGFTGHALENKNHVSVKLEL